MTAGEGTAGEGTAGEGTAGDCIRVAAVGDVHVGHEGEGDPPGFDGVEDAADALLLAGDLTRTGDRSEVERLASCLALVPVPVVAVLGNHDHHVDTPGEVVSVLRSVGVTVLERSSTVLDVRGHRVGVAGAKGFGGGMPGAAATAFGEPEMKAFVEHGAQVAKDLGVALAQLDAQLRIVLLHYSPVAETLEGEPPEIHAFLGDYRLAEEIDRYGADLVLHGHAHMGRERGRTPGGVPVRNVAKPVIRAPYRVFELPVRRASEQPVVGATVDGQAGARHEAGVH